jgi:hypothetical protein
MKTVATTPDGDREIARRINALHAEAEQHRNRCCDAVYEALRAAWQGFCVMVGTRLLMAYRLKAAINGVPSLSILDGWWIEGWIKGVTGWAIDSTAPVNGDRTPHDALSLYDKLEQVVIPLFYRNRSGFIGTMRHAIALNGSFFNTQRMLLRYVLKAYFSLKLTRSFAINRHGLVHGRANAINRHEESQRSE